MTQRIDREPKFKAWPFVDRPHYRDFRSIFHEPEPPYIWRLKPNVVTNILNVQSESTVDRLFDYCRKFPFEVPKISGAIPMPPQHPGISPDTQLQPTWADFDPTPKDMNPLKAILNSLSSDFQARMEMAKREFNQAQQQWNKARYSRERAQRSFRQKLAQFEVDTKDHEDRKKNLELEFKDAMVEYQTRKQRYEAKGKAEGEKLYEIEARCLKAEGAAIEEMTTILLQQIPLPIAWPQRPKVKYDSESSSLLIEVQIPNVEDHDFRISLKTKDRELNQKEKSNLQETMAHCLCLRVLHEVYNNRPLKPVALACVNARLSYINRANGQQKNEIIASVSSPAKDFEGIDVSKVDAKACFRSLKGIQSPSYTELSAVPPILSINHDDDRIVPSRELIDEIPESKNLAMMDWEDFEHLVRELFSKIFTARSAQAEVNVTRASRDYGVDAIIFDPDPIYGGKFIVQAKRYTRRVDVAAVRELFGTVQNEGANKGYLVTTSSFGPDAHQFATDKPITLIDGRNLLALFEQHGYSFKIDIQQARSQ